MRPALWTLHDGTSQLHSFPFPRSIGEYRELDVPLIGELPKHGVRDFLPKARFGFNGLHQVGSTIYAASHSAVYVIDSRAWTLTSIITHPLMNNIHGIFVDEADLYFTNPALDALIRVDLVTGASDAWCVGPKLEVQEISAASSAVDWRFAPKQLSGPQGIFHFNFVRIENECAWLTSRNLSSLIEVDLAERSASVVPLSQHTPLLLHDGARYGESLYFTSVDGKILKARPSDPDAFAQWEDRSLAHLGNRGLTTSLTRLSETEFGREPNWCRGVAFHEGVTYVTVDGRYDTNLAFSLLGLEGDGRIALLESVPWGQIADPADLRHVTGFDVEVLT